MTLNSGWVGFDLDGTLAKYDGWKGHQHIGAPIPNMIRLLKAISADYEVRIFTARASGEESSERSQSIQAIEAWCLKHIGRILPITCVKDYRMVTLYDDRAIQVEFNTGRIVTKSWA